MNRRSGKPVSASGGGNKGIPHRKICFEFARTGRCSKPNCPWVHAAERRPDGQAQTLGHMGGEGEPPAFLDEFAEVTWDDEYACYLCTLPSADTAEKQAQEQDQHDVNALGGDWSETSEIGWPNAANIGDFSCLEVPQKSVTFNFGTCDCEHHEESEENERIRWARRVMAETEQIKRDQAAGLNALFGPKLTPVKASDFQGPP